MGKPKAYNPVPGYRYQILTRSEGERTYQHLNHARNRQEVDHIIGEHRMTFKDNAFKTIKLPTEYWDRIVQITGHRQTNTASYYRRGKNSGGLNDGGEHNQG